MTGAYRIRVDRCVCLGRSFAELAAVAEREGLSLEAVMSLPAPGGRRCGMCRPYVRVALTSGQTVFHELLPPDEPEQGAGPAGLS